MVEGSKTVRNKLTIRRDRITIGRVMVVAGASPP